MIPQVGGADILGLQKQINAEPDPMLQKLVASKQPGASMLALMALDTRNKMRAQAQMPQMQQQAQQPPVAQKVVQQSQQAGIPQLPTGTAIPQQYAEGGIVKHFEVGGEVTADEWLARLTRGLTGQDYRGTPVIRTGEAFNRPYPAWQGVTFPEGTGARMGNALFPALVASPDDANFSNVQAGNSTRSIGVAQPGGAASPIGAAPPEAPGTGIAAFRLPQRPGVPEFVDPRTGAPAMNMSDAEWSAFVEKKRAEIEKLMGPSYADKYIAELQQQRDTLKNREPTRQNEAWLKAGLTMMSGKSRHGMINIGQGGIAGIDQYRADRTADEAKSDALRREMMGLEAGKQQRADQQVMYGIGRGDIENQRMAQQRAEALGVGAARNKYAMDVYEAGAKWQLADAAVMQAQAHMAQAAAHAQQNRDYQTMNAITTAEKRIDASVKMRMQGLDVATMTQPQYEAAYNRIWIEERNKELNSNPYFAKALGSAQQGISASSVGLGKK